jgi:histidinol-phosphate aminotransferase
LALKKRRFEISSLVRENILSLEAYGAGPVNTPSRLKLDANESPYGFDLPAGVLKKIETNRYPDPEAAEMRRAFGRSVGVKDTQRILHGNGSDELISLLITAFGGPVLYPVPTFSMYGIIARAQGREPVEVRLDGRFDIDLEAFSRAMRKKKPRLIFLSSPNNPTGNRFSEKKILRVIEQARESIVVVDEAYAPFASGGTFLRHLHRFGNLAVLRTLSKFGLAALRVGFLVAGPELISFVNRARLPFNVNSLSQAAAIYALGQTRRIKKIIREIVSERQRLSRELSKTEGITVYPSEANFLLFKAPRAETLCKELFIKGVLLKNLCPQLEGCLRVTVGTRKQNDLFLKTLRKAAR